MQTLITSRKLIVLLVTAMLLVVAASNNSNAQGLQSDEFDGSGQNLQSFWEVQNTFWHVQEGNEGSYMLSDGNLVVEGAFYQNLWDADYTRRFYQVTDQKNFSVETSLIFDHKDVCAVAGLIIKSPTQNEWVTLKMWGQSAEGAFGNAPNTAKLEFQHRERHILGAFGYIRPGGKIPIALRLDRDGDNYTAWYKPDAQGEWVFAGETTVALEGPVEVGIFSGICQDETEGGFLTVTVDYFRATTDATELAQQIQAGPKIEGPWLWMIAPIGDRRGEEAVTSGIDFLAEASNGSVTETAIATEGASAGGIVGNRRWTPGKIAPTGWNNMNDLVNAIGLGFGDVDFHVAYGSITLESPSEQETTMYVGSDDSVKVWLNGALVHSNPIEGGAIGYQESFPVTLKEGENILLVAVYESWGGWSGFFGFEKGTTYTVVPPAEMPTTPTVDITHPIDVVIYTNLSAGIDVPDAEMAAETTRNLLEAEGISVEITKDGAFVRDWMLQTTNDGSVNVIVLYGVLPGSVYAAGDGSIAENWIETMDGNTILNHAEYIGYYVDVGTGNRNWDTVGVHGLQNLMDNPNITSFIHGQGYDDPLPMIVTSDGTAFTPSLANFGSYRPMSLNQLQGRWFAEKVFASDTGNAQATYADPVIVRDGNLGRLAILHSSNQPAESKSLPNGEVAAEIISNYLIQETTGTPKPPVDIAPNYSQIYVDAVNGVNATTGRGSADKPYKTITLALAISARNNLPDPWYVRIRPGTYHADPAKPVQEREIFPLKLRNGMIIEGTTNANECIIDAQHLGETKVPILLGENVGGVHIRNLTVQNMDNIGDRNNNSNNEAQIMLSGTTEIPNTLEGCIVRGIKTDSWGTTHGLWTETPLVLVANTFINNLAAGVWALNNVVANNNTFDGNKEGGLLIGGRIYDSSGRENWIRVDSIGNITKNIFRNNSGWDDQRAVLYLNGSLNGNVSHNTFTGNNSKYLMYTGNITGDVTHNTFENNGTAVGDNGCLFIFNFNGNFTHNTFTGNYSSDFILRNMTRDISYNKFIEYFSHVEVHNPITVKVSHNIFESNTQDTYGNTKSGIRIDNRSGSENSIIEFSNNIFYNNKSIRADYVSSVRVENRPVHFINNLFMVPDESTAVESAPAIWLNSPECRFHNNIFAGMQTAIYVDGTDSIPITHNIFYSIGKDIVSQAGSGLGNDLELWELLAGNASNNLALIPLFVDPLNEKDFHLKPASPAIDAGTNMYAPEDDFDGVARPVGDTVDIGPYEYVGKKEDTVFELGAWDVDENGVVNILDLVIVSQNFGLSPPTNPRADVTGDGHVNILDLVLIAQHFGESAGASPSANVPVQEYIEPGTVQTWIALAQVADDGSAVFREGIANLKRLLAVSTPQKTALLANYPNPFNPETWIPYQLANPADVSITIYAADGKLVRTLTLGHQAVGKYHDRSRAAYWNGKNETGESVASGVYFYTLTAGDFSATRKMLIRK